MAAPVIVRDADVDDDGTNTTGTVHNNAWKTAIYTRIDAVVAALWALIPLGPIIQTITLTGTQNDVALTTGCTLLRVNNATLVTLTGFSAGTDGQLVQIVSIGAGQVDLTNQAAGSAAANRLINGITGLRSLAPGTGTATIQYDATTARWRVVAHDQGAWITPAYAAGNFTGLSAMTWTVDAGDVTTYAYVLRGTTLTLAINLNTTTVGGTLNTQLKVAIPGGYVSAKDVEGSFFYQDNGTNGNGLAIAQAAATVCLFLISSLGNWAAATNTTVVRAVLAFEVS